MRSRALHPVWLIVILCSLAHNLPAAAAKTNVQTRVELTTFALKTPSAGGWRRTGTNKPYSYVLFVHNDVPAHLSAAWTPLLESYKTEDAGKTMEQYIRRRINDLFDNSPDTHVAHIELSGIETINGLPYQRWQIGLTHPDKNKKLVTYEIVTLARTASQAPDIYLFTLMLRAQDSAKLPEFERTLRELVECTHYLDYNFADVANIRVAIASTLFFQAVERETKDRDTNKIHAAKLDLLAELNYSRAVLTNAPEPWIIRARVAEYNQDDLRYGGGFDAARAEACYRNALALEPGYFPALENLARLFEATNRMADAERAWKEAVEIEPANGDCHYRLGRFYQKQNRDAEAVEQFKQALRFWRGAPLTKQELEREVAALSKKLGKK